MKFRGILALAFTLSCAQALAQVTPGTSPLSGPKGGTNNAFMQFTGPASSLKTFTVPNASGTLAALNAIETWSAAQSFTDGTLILLGSSSGSSTLKAPATGGGTATLFPGSDTIAGLSATQTLTNKTFNCANNTCTVRLGSDVTGQLPIANGGTGQATQTAGFNALAPTPTRAGDVAYWNGSNWVTLAGNNSGTQVLTENASGVPSWSAPGAGTVTTAGNGLTLSGGGTTLGITAPVSVANGGTGAIVGPARSTGTFSNMAGTTSTTPVMNGLAGSITPTISGHIFVSMFGIANNNTANDGCAWTVRVGTGGAPVNGAPATGTSITPNLGTMTSSSAALQLPFPAIGYSSSALTVGTAYWIDLAFNAVTGGTCTLSTIGMVAIEE